MELIAIGIIRRPVGICGACSVEPFGAGFASLKAPCSVIIGTGPENAETVTIGEISSHGGGFRCRFIGKSDRNAVEGLRGTLVFIDPGTLPRLPENEFYHFELKGMEVYGDGPGKRLGTIVEVHNLPTLDAVEVALNNGETVLLPLSGRTTPVIDRAARRITVSQSFVDELLA